MWDCTISDLIFCHNHFQTKSKYSDQTPEKHCRKWCDGVEIGEGYTVSFDSCKYSACRNNIIEFPLKIMVPDINQVVYEPQRPRIVSHLLLCLLLAILDPQNSAWPSPFCMQGDWSPGDVPIILFPSYLHLPNDEIRSILVLKYFSHLLLFL